MRGDFNSVRGSGMKRHTVRRDLKSEQDKLFQIVPKANRVKDCHGLSVNFIKTIVNGPSMTKEGLSLLKPAYKELTILVKVCW